ncbi:Bro-N domain-containing protein [Oceanobacillus oncorhynchi]|uniref:BRO-N domain-containing protein n=1 Tax=Oceanobacillus oncorhynchi TaxID=545501 RepID=UPI001D014070|nr:BRO family protein [Oceanobacillus oncorhynchi]
MNQLTKMFEGNQLRIIEQNNEPWFVAKDVCDILEINNNRQALARLDEDEKAGVTLNDGSQNRKYQAVNEFGLYNLVLSSRKPEAKQFKRWVTHEVIPSIRKTGSYQSEIDTSQLSPELQMFNGLYQSLAKQEVATKQLETRVDNISNIVSMNSDEWRNTTDVVLKKIAAKWTGVEPYRSVRNLSYERFEKKAKCKLELRLNNRKERALAQGMSKSYINKINKLDCISEDKRLVEIYIQVVKEMAIQFRVDVSDLKGVI